MDNNSGSRLPHVLLGLYLVEFVLLAFRPFDRPTWWAENVLISYPVLVIMSVAAFYEIVEWIYAASAAPEAGAAYLGSQGDVWDAQKDMLADTLGALCGVAVFLAQGGVSTKDKEPAS